MSADVQVPLDKVQGIILRGYELLEEARFLLLEIPDARAGRTWLRDLAGKLTSAAVKPQVSAINVAFTIAGLRQLGLIDEACLAGFSREFLEGIDTDHRQRILGDIESTGQGSLPDWHWGKRTQAPREHVLLMAYAKDKPGLEGLLDTLQHEYERAGLRVVRKFDIVRLHERKEHFGFRDGIAQPFVRGVVKNDPASLQQTPPAVVQPKIPENSIETGEFLLGYRNEYNRYPPSPTVPATGTNPPLDFGCHGSYLVVRELQQDVHAFWNFIDEKTARPNQTPQQHREARDLLAAKMVGRWTSGAPLTLSPDKDDSTQANADDYQFSINDPLGVRNPIGSHTRRSNPRDSLEPGLEGKERLSAEDSLRISRLHRIIRRGRPYGPPVSASMDHAEILQQPKPADDPERGLLFLCFNANIARQFEFIQQTWINNPKFGGLYRDTDPLMGQRRPGELDEPANDFTVQATPVRRRFTGLPAFVQVRGGGYFFMPGIEAVKFLAGTEAEMPAPSLADHPSAVASGQHP